MKETFDKYIIVTGFDKTLVQDNSTYGKYNMRRCLTVNFLDAIKDCELDTIYDFYHDFRRKMPAYRIVDLETERIRHIDISNFDFYIALDEDNKEWKDPKNYLKRFPCSYSRKALEKLITNLIKKHIK